MNSRDYWKHREDEALKHRITDEKEYDREIKRIYSDMLDSVQEQINAFYGKYATAEGITLAEAKKRVSKANIAEYERKAKRYVKDKDFSAKANEEMRLYNAMMKINRMEMLKANIGLETIAGHAELEKFMAGILKGRTEDELKRQAGILGKTVRNNAAKSDAIVNGSFHSGTFSDRIWQYQDLMREDLGRMLQTGLIQGKNPRAIMKDLKKYWYGNDPKTGGGAVYCMERLMRTELARVQTEAQKQSFERNGFDKYEFISNHGCCDICSGLNGKHFKVSEMMPGENAPPMHPNCRCSTAAWEDNVEYEAWLNYLENGGTTESWNEFLETIERLPDIKNKKVKAGVETLESKLQHSKGIENHVSNMQMYNAYTEYKYDKSLPCAFAYDPAQDVILYNSKLKEFQEIDRTFAVAHELSHRMDRLQYKSWKNPQFLKAIEDCKTAVLEHKLDIEKWFDYNGKYEFEDGLQDIISALSKNKVRTWVGHDTSYWEKPNNVAKEIFANMSAIDVLDADAKQEFDKLLKPLYEAYKGIVK